MQSFQTSFIATPFLQNKDFNYISTTLKKANVCAVYLGIPRSVYSLGTSSQNVSVREEGFQRHCDILSSSDRKGVSDTQDKIKEQCAYYEKYVNKTYSSSANLLSSNMVDSGLIVRDMYNDRCRKFNAVSYNSAEVNI